MLRQPGVKKASRPVGQPAFQILVEMHLTVCSC